MKTCLKIKQKTKILQKEIKNLQKHIKKRETAIQNARKTKADCRHDEEELEKLKATKATLAIDNQILQDRLEKSKHALFRSVGV